MMRSDCEKSKTQNIMPSKQTETETETDGKIDRKTDGKTLASVMDDAFSISEKALHFFSSFSLQ